MQYVIGTKPLSLSFLSHTHIHTRFCRPSPEKQILKLSPYMETRNYNINRGAKGHFGCTPPHHHYTSAYGNRGDYGFAGSAGPPRRVAYFRNLHNTDGIYISY